MICTQFSGHWMDNTNVALKTGSVLFAVNGNAAGARPGGTRRSAGALQYPIHSAACAIKQGTVAQKTLQQSLRALCGVFGKSAAQIWYHKAESCTSSQGGGK